MPSRPWQSLETREKKRMSHSRKKPQKSTYKKHKGCDWEETEWEHCLYSISMNLLSNLIVIDGDSSQCEEECELCNVFLAINVSSHQRIAVTKYM